MKADARRKADPIRWMPAVLALAAAVVAPAAAQDKRPAPGVDQAAINAAIEKGAKWLLEQARAKVPLPAYGAGHMQGADTVDELALYALLHSEVDPKTPEVVKLLEEVTSRPYKKTYTVAIRAQALHQYEVLARKRKDIQMMDVVKLADQVRNCSQYLIDNQGKAGYWDYGREVNLPAGKITITPDSSLVYTGLKGTGPTDVFIKQNPSGGGGNTSARNRIILKRNGWGGDHDNSNAQYALLGLAAGMASSFYPPKEDCLDLAEKWFTDQQNEDGGWNYGARGGGSYGSMTAGGVSSMCIILRAKGNMQPQKDLRVQKGLRWLGANLNFATNPNKGGWHYYWIYSVERAGSMADTDWFGDRPWYKEGAAYLLPVQNADGSWGNDKEGKKICDTAWAILFLRRATKGLIMTGTSSHGTGVR
jgi:hypothetical protein